MPLNSRQKSGIYAKEVFVSDSQTLGSAVQCSANCIFIANSLSCPLGAREESGGTQTPLL